ARSGYPVEKHSFSTVNGRPFRPFPLCRGTAPRAVRLCAAERGAEAGTDGVGTAAFNNPEGAFATVAGKG
ncbi:MAG: hypothetical protein Q4C13_07740, partial [Clostridia bacterium]|nr:hypothetical protein [Clostridia bacterium]